MSELMQEVSVAKMREMKKLVDEIHRPKVSFTGNMDGMRKEADQAKEKAASLLIGEFMRMGIE